MQVWDIKRRQVLNCMNPSPLLLKCFDPTKSLYLYEPGESKKEPYFAELSMPIMCSVSPDENRYKEFKKDGAMKVFMPTWALPELQAVGEFVCKRGPEYIGFSSEEISKRFAAVGGIFRHAFAPDFDTVLEDQKEAIQNLDPTKFKLNKIDRNPPQVSHYVAQYVVTTEGDKAFQEANIDFVSDDVRKAAEAAFTAMDSNDKIWILRKNDECPSFMASACGAIFEDVIAGQLVEEVHWETRNLTDSNFSRFNLKLTKIALGEPPNFAVMTPMVLYRPLSKTHPAVDMMYKTKEGLLYGLQVTRKDSTTRTIGTTTVDKWLDSIKWRDSMEKVRIAVVPKPKLADMKKKKPDLEPHLAERLKVVFEGDGEGYPPLEVWKVPPDYGRSF